MVLGGPDLWHDLTEQDQNERDEYDLDQEFEEPEALFEQDHGVNKEIGEDDDRDIDDGIGDEEGGEQGLWVFEQGNDPFPGGVLLGFQYIDVLIGECKKSHFGT